MTKQAQSHVAWPARGDRFDGGNVVLFSRRSVAAPPIVLGPADRPVPRSADRDPRGLWPIFFACALALHAGLYALERKPAPLASVGEVSISVDILLGSPVAAGLASTPSPSAMASPDAKETEQPVQADTAEPAPAQVPAHSAEREPEPQLNAEPSVREPVEPSMTGSIERKPNIERKPKIERKQPDKARETRAKPQREAKRQPAESARTAPSPIASTPSTASSGAGRGRSDADSNYAGRVFAHLARHQQAPSDARDVPPITVMLSIDGSGRVTGVRLTRPSGIASFDQEVHALIRRASPLPAPPSGRATTLNWSVKFRAH
jgi:protein TonB